MLDGARLEPVMLFFASLAADGRARAAYRESCARQGVACDAPMADLARWHALEERDPELFGRMHVLYCRAR